MMVESIMRQTMNKLPFLVLMLGVIFPTCQSLDVELRKQAVPNYDGDEIWSEQMKKIGIFSESYGAQPFIVNGEEAIRNSIPYQGALFVPVGNGRSFCGCSLINAQTVITAAHCVDTRTGDVTVVFGAHNVNENETTTQTFETGNIIIHPNWTRPTLLHDVAIIQLPEPVTINQYVRPITLPRNADQDYLGNQTLVTGWGRPSDSINTISPVLREVSVPIISNAACNMAYQGLIDPSRICTSGAYGRGTCNGDSGGPLTLNGVLIGVVSFVSVNGCESGWPPGYARVTFYLDWISQNSL